MIDIKEKAIQNHKEKMKNILDEMNRVSSKQRYLQLKKCYHRLEKELAIYIKYKYNEDVIFYKGKWRGD